jgi:hypothetical protein
VAFFFAVGLDTAAMVEQGAVIELVETARIETPPPA